MEYVLGWLVALAVSGGVKPFKGEALGTFSFHVCAADAPARAQCLHDDVAGQITHLGRTIGSFEVVFDIARFGDDSCGPVSKKGSFIASNGDWLHVEAEGTFCFNTLVAVYRYRITGGTGKFAGARGEGKWTVPLPTTFDGAAGTGDEVLSGWIAMHL